MRIGIGIWMAFYLIVLPSAVLAFPLRVQVQVEKPQAVSSQLVAPKPSFFLPSTPSSTPTPTPVSSPQISPFPSPLAQPSPSPQPSQQPSLSPTSQPSPSMSPTPSTSPPPSPQPTPITAIQNPEFHDGLDGWRHGGEILVVEEGARLTGGVLEQSWIEQDTDDISLLELQYSIVSSEPFLEIDKPIFEVFANTQSILRVFPQETEEEQVVAIVIPANTTVIRVQTTASWDDLFPTFITFHKISESISQTTPQILSASLEPTWTGFQILSLDLLDSRQVVSASIKAVYNPSSTPSELEIMNGIDLYSTDDLSNLVGIPVRNERLELIIGSPTLPPPFSMFVQVIDTAGQASSWYEMKGDQYGLY